MVGEDFHSKEIHQRPEPSRTETLVELTKNGRPGARNAKRANILLLADQGDKNEEIAILLHTSRNTVIRNRLKFINGFLAFAALSERLRTGRFPKMGDKIETISTSLAQSIHRAGANARPCSNWQTVW